MRNLLKIYTYGFFKSGLRFSLKSFDKFTFPMVTLIILLSITYEDVAVYPSIILDIKGIIDVLSNLKQRKAKYKN
jgi:hypothetical protein